MTSPTPPVPLRARAATVLIALALAVTAGATAQTTPDSALRTGTPPDSILASTPPVASGDSSFGAAVTGQIPEGTSSPAAASGDSATAAPAPTDTGVVTATGVYTTTRAPSAGIQPPSTSTGPTVTRVAPPDTILARACAGAPGGSEAAGLLTVVFRAETPEKERAEAAQAVGGTLGGPTDYGEEYVLVPGDVGPLATVADSLIRQEPVTRVSTAPCPVPSPTPGAVRSLSAPADVPDTTGATPRAAPSTSTDTVPGAAGDTVAPAPTLSP